MSAVAPPFAITLVLQVFSLLGLAGAPLGGWVADRYGRTMVVAPALALVGASAAGTALAGSQEAMLAAIIFWGLGNSLISPVRYTSCVHIACLCFQHSPAKVALSC